MSIGNRTQFIEYCLRSLGAPVLEVNIDDDQINDRIDEALLYFNEYSWDGIQDMLMKHEVTQQDVDNGYILIPDYVIGVTKVLPYYGSQASNGNIFDLQYQLRMNDLFNLASSNIAYYHNTLSYLSMLDMLLNGQQLLRFNRWEGKLHIDCDWHKKFPLGTHIIVQGYRALNPTDMPKVFNNIWLKHYATALLKRQWGVNLKKFSGISLPGGVQLDGQSMYDEAMGEIKDLEDQLINESAPLNWFMG